jgi:protease I
MEKPLVDSPKRKEGGMASELQGKRIAFLVAQKGIEEVELTKPWQAVKDAGGTPS